MELEKEELTAAREQFLVAAKLAGMPLPMFTEGLGYWNSYKRGRTGYPPLFDSEFEAQVDLAFHDDFIDVMRGPLAALGEYECEEEAE